MISLKTKENYFNLGLDTLVWCEESKTSIGVRISSGISSDTSGGLANISSSQNIRVIDKLNKHNTLLFSIMYFNNSKLNKYITLLFSILMSLMQRKLI